MGKNIKIVLIDTGVEAEHPVFKGHKIKGISIAINDRSEMVISDDIRDEIGHGTATGGIIVRNCPDIDLFVIKIYHNDVPTDALVLTKALEYVYDYVECDIINMSLGCIYDSNKMHDVCRRLSRKGVVMLAAFDNTGAVSYPAAYKEVLGVDSSVKCVFDDDYIIVNGTVINCLAKSGNIRVAWKDGKYRIERGASFATAYMSSIVANILSENGNDKGNLKRQLKKGAFETLSHARSNGRLPDSGSEKLLKKTYNAALVPYNKEMHSLVNFDEMLGFRIEGVYDIRQCGNIGKHAHGLGGEKKYTIRDYKEIDYDKIDTVIIGHLTKLSEIVRYDLKKELLEKCLANGTNVFCFDDYLVKEYREAYLSNGLNLVCPDSGLFYNNKHGKLYAIESPVLGVYGTSSSQGKFTLQLQLRKIFQRKGYKVGQLGTEPSSKLFGMDEVLAYGYDRTVSLSESDLAEVTNYLIHRIDVKNPDIILVGSQSNTIPYTIYNMNQMSLHQIGFLLGGNPDIAIICVNLYDDIDYVKRSVYAIENLVECRVIAIAVSPLYFANEWQLFCNIKEIAKTEMIDEYKNMLQTCLKIKAYTIGTSEIEGLVEDLLDNMS